MLLKLWTLFKSVSEIWEKEAKQRTQVDIVHWLSLIKA